MKSVDSMYIIRLASRITLASSRLTGSIDDEALAAYIAEMQDAQSQLIDLLAERHPAVIVALARRLNTPRALRHALSLEIPAP